MKTLRNKLISIGLIILGILSIIPEKDITAFIFFFIFAVPMFFAKEDVFK